MLWFGLILEDVSVEVNSDDATDSSEDSFSEAASDEASREEGLEYIDEASVIISSIICDGTA